VNAFNHARGIGCAFRYIPNKIRSLSELGLPKVLEKFARYKRGLVLVTGPTGSGKSTTLAAIIDLINETRAEHILTIEDPVEYIYQPKKALINQREVGPHTKSFAGALRAALREDPDIILVGEMRDLETISLALTAAETGHLVFATLHTNSAVETIDRIIDVFPAHQQTQIRTQLAETLKAVVSQLLIRKRDLMGRVCATEILICNYAVKNMIREQKTFQIPSLMQTSSGLGMITMEQCLKNLALSGKISREDAIEFSGNPALFEKKAKAK
jgi:twitching motility protein PilT